MIGMNNNNDNNNAHVDPAEESVEQQLAETDLHHHLQQLSYDGLAIMFCAMSAIQTDQ